MKLNLPNLLLFIIFILALFLRFNNLVSIPNGFNQDESAIGYNAYSIIQTGKDEHGIAYPLYFKSFGDQKLPTYIYLTVLSEKIFGVNEFAVRFPSAFFGSITVLLIFFLVKLVTENRKLALISALLLALNPWHLFFSRAAFEDNVALSFSVLGTVLFIFATKSKKGFYFFLSVLSFALSVYAYNVTRVLAPLLFVSLIVLYWDQLKKFPKQTFLGFLIFFFLLLSPFFLTLLSPAGINSADGALITSKDIEAQSLEMRSYLVANHMDLLGKIIFNKYIFMLWYYLENLAKLFSSTFLFISGSTHGSQGIGNAGMFYLVELPFIMTGLCAIFIKKLKKFSLFVVWFVITVLVASLSKEVPHATRGYFLVIPLTIFSAFGLLTLYIRIISLKKTNLKIVIFVVAGLIITYNLVYYFSSYYFRFPLLYAGGWRQQDKALVSYLRENGSKYDTIVFDNSAEFIYTSLLFYEKYPPEKFQREARRSAPDGEGFITVNSFGKYQWKDIDWQKDLQKKKTLFITTKDRVPGNAGILKTFYYPQVPVVLSIKEQLVQYPEQKEAYILIETK